MFVDRNLLRRVVALSRCTCAVTCSNGYDLYEKEQKLEKKEQLRDNEECATAVINDFEPRFSVTSHVADRSRSRAAISRFLLRDKDRHERSVKCGRTMER